MNKLTKFLVSSILNEDKVPGKTALFGGGFKPPTRGHLEVVLQGLKEYPEIDEVYIFVGSGVRNNISQEEAIKIWEMYKPFIPVKSTIIKSGSPLKDMKRFIEDSEGDKPYIFIGAREGNEDDDKDVAERSKFFEKYGGIPKRINTSDPNVSGTRARNAAKEDNKEELFSYFPDALSDSQKEEIYDMLRSVVNELEDKEIEYWATQADIFSILKKYPNKYKELAQKLVGKRKEALDYFWNTYFKDGEALLNEHSMGSAIDILPKLAELTQHMIDKGYNIEPLPGLELIDDDVANAEDFLGKTAYYDPNTQTIVLYTHGRHPKDIARSYAHEMIHHIQNLEGRLGNITTTNTQEDDHLNDIEAEANLKGTMTFRNWTDSLNEVGDASQKSYNWNRKVSKDPDDGLIEGVDYRFTTDLDTNYVAFFQMVGPMEYEFGFNIPGGNQAQVSNKGELFRVMATMVAIMKDFMDLMGNDWSEILFSGSKDPSRSEDNRRDKLYMAYIKKNLPSTVSVGVDDDDMTVLTNTLAEGFNKKLGKDPFGLNQFARELMAEGAYDSLVTKLTKATITKWVKDSKKKPLPKKSFVDIDIDDVDGKGREIEFNYVGLVEFDKKVDGYEVDGTSNSGEDKGKMPFVATLFRINPKVLPQAWSKISADVSDVIRHEIEHLTQAGDNVRGQVYDDEGNLISKGKYMEDDIMIRDMINKLKVLPKSDYYKLEKEVDAMLQGLYLKAKKTKKPFADVIDQYLDMAPGIDTKEDKEAILNLWRSRRKALSLPVFETKKQVMQEGMEDLYTIYLDMDGVIVDFDRQFEEAFGMSPREFEEAFGTEMFWKKIEERGVGFWRGMEWMPGGQELYNRISQFDHYLLSSPSRSETSKIGKHLWKKDNTPGTKLILARSYNKKNYADKSNILIDDREDNIQQWRDAGGIGILYKSAAQVNKELDKLGL
jgi:PAS domain-containing protein